MDTALNSKKRNKKLVKALSVVMAVVLVFVMGSVTSFASIPATSLHVHGAMFASSVTVVYDGSTISLTRHGGTWKTPDGGEYYTDLVEGVWVNSLWYPRTNLSMGVEAGGTLNIWLLALPKYTIDTTVTNGTIDPDESGITAGSNRTITYSANPGFHLYNVIVDGVSQDIGTYPASYSFTNINANHTIAVVYAINTYSIDTTVTNGTITPDESGIAAGSDRTITYSPDPGFHLESVTVDGTPQDIGTYPTSYSFTDINADHTVAVVYAINTYSIDTTVTNGTISPDESGITAGSDRTITYSADPGFHLESITVDGAPQDIGTHPTSYSFMDINANHTVAVVYAVSTYSIDTTATNGTITPDESGITAGSDRTITYSADPGFHLESVTVDGAPQDIGTYPASYSFTEINMDHSISVVFAADTIPDDTYTIDTTVAGGTITPDESGITAGENRTITYSPDSGNYLVSVTVDGQDVDITIYPTSYTFADINENHTISVVYGGNVVTDTDTDFLIMIAGVLLLAGGTLIGISKIRRKVKI